MARPLRWNAVFVLTLMLVAIAEASTPPGIANNPSHARCLIKKYKHCYNLEHVCPKFCPDSCHVECVSCKPICGAGPTNPPPDSDDGKGNDDNGKGKGNDDNGKGAQTPPTTTPQYPPTLIPVAPSRPPPSQTPPTSPPQSSPLPTPTTPTSSPPLPTPSPPSSTPTTPPTPTTPSPSPSTSTSPYPTPSTPSPTSQAPPAPPVSPSPPNDSSEAAGGRRKRCRNRNYPQCYGVQHVCPSSCPHTCEVDCVTCKPVCKCDMPGAVCQDPRFIGGDGITFYFHGKKDHDFCLVTEPNLHINAHFIGRRNENMKRDFTWVQSIAVLFGDHRLYVGAQKTATWNDAVDRLSLSFDGQPIVLPAAGGSTWRPTALPSAAVKRDADANSVVVEVDGLFEISAKAVPITQQESKTHNYGITEDDCFAHLELGFKFNSLSDNVNGVLGQTYGRNYVSRVKMGVPMPVLGGDKEFAVSSLFGADCAVSQFRGGKLQFGGNGLELPGVKCTSGIDGRGVVCKR